MADTLGISNQFELLQAALLLTMPGAYAFKKGVELRGVIQVLKVTQLMQHDIILEVLRYPHQIQVKINVPFRGAAAPVGTVVLYSQSVILEAMKAC